MMVIVGALVSTGLALNVAANNARATEIAMLEDKVDRFITEVYRLDQEQQDRQGDFKATVNTINLMILDRVAKIEGQLK